MNKEEPMISKYFLLLFLFSLLVYTGMNMLTVIVPLYVTENLQQSTGVAGLMTTVYTISACLSRPINGLLTDRLGRRTMMILGISVFCGGCLVCGLVPSIVVLAVCRILMGIGYSAATTANNTASTDVIPASRMAEGIGYFGMSQSMASATGPALAALVITAWGNQASLLFDGGIAAAALVVALTIRYERTMSRPRKAANSPKKAGLFERTAGVPALYQGLSLFLISCMMCFTTLYIVSQGLSSGVAGSFFVVASVMIVGVRLTCSKLMNRLSPVCFLIPGYLLLIALCFLLPQAHTVAMFLFCGVVYGLAHGTIWMTLGSEAVRYAPPEARGTANATFYFAFDAAIGTGAAFWGTMIDRIGYISCYSVIAVCASVLLISSIPVFRARQKKYHA
jgi:predicted MFS family arabinose efflux permease